MNLFSGMTDRQILSAVMTFVLFNGYVVLMVIALASFYVTSRPRRGRVRTAPILHIVAVVWFLMALISTVWAAPAEKSFIDADTPPGDHLFAGERFGKVIIGVGFAFIGVLCVLAGFIAGARQKRAIARQALLEGV
jgi:amino acid transporter